MTTSRDSIGMTGVGRMGGAIAQRLIDCAVPLTRYDLDPDRVGAIAALDADTATSIDDLTTRCRQASRHDVGLVDAPVSGEVDRAANGTLVTMLGGRENAVDAACLIVGTYCADVIRVGPAGADQLAKTTNNLVSIVNTVVVHEALRLADAHGFEPADALRVAALGSGASNAVATWAWRSEMIAPGAPRPNQSQERPASSSSSSLTSSGASSGM